ncbi:MAG: hypothetical protein GY861_21230 [bacterium]|nr:hypothetical protein [bacterium]
MISKGLRWLQAAEMSARTTRTIGQAIQQNIAKYLTFGDIISYVTDPTKFLHNKRVSLKTVGCMLRYITGDGSDTLCMISFDPNVCFDIRENNSATSLVSLLLEEGREDSLYVVVLDGTEYILKYPLMSRSDGHIEFVSVVDREDAVGRLLKAFNI